MKKIGDIIELQKQDVIVCECEKCNNLMVNVNPKEVMQGDLITLKRLGLTLTNPATKDNICLKCEIDREEKESIFKRKVETFISKPSHDDDNDSGFFGGSSGGFGGFGGFGGGSFSGGGASGSW